jgi:hypothetical protein
MKLDIEDEETHYIVERAQNAVQVIIAGGAVTCFDAIPADAITSTGSFECANSPSLARDEVDLSRFA